MTQDRRHLQLGQDLLHLTELLHQVREVGQAGPGLLTARLTAVQLVVVVVAGDPLQPLGDRLECVDLGWLDRTGQQSEQ